MKRSVVVLLVIMSFFVGCRTKSSAIEEINPQYFGTYDPVQYSEVLSQGSVNISNYQSRGTITVSKGSTAMEMVLKFDFPNSQEQLTATVKGNQFTITDKTKESITLGSATYVGDYTATGEFATDGSLIVRTQVSAARNGGQTIQKTATFAGTKKS